MLDAQHIAVALVLQAAASFAQRWCVVVQGEQNAVRQVIDPGQWQHHTFTHGLVAAVVMGEGVGQVIGQLLVLLEPFEQLDIAKQKVVDPVIEHFAEFMAHLFSLLLRSAIAAWG